MPDDANELDQIKEQALEFGRRLGLLLATAQMPDEQKQAWLALIPAMNAQQMAEFAQAVEHLIPDAEEQGFAELARRLAAGQARHASSVATATAEAQKSLDEVEGELRPPAV